MEGSHLLTHHSEPTSSTLFVADLPFNVQESDFIRLFEPLDGFVSARLRQDRNERYNSTADHLELLGL